MGPFRLALAFASVLAAGVAGAGDAGARPKAPFKLLYNNDTTNILSNVSPWHEEGQPFEERMLVASIEEAAEGVDVHLLSPGMGWVPWWRSKVHARCFGGDHFSWWMKRTGLKPRGFEKYVHEGGDMVQVLVDTCRKHGVAPFVSLRMNDVHHQEHYNRKTPRSAVSCRFYCEHPEWFVDPHHQTRKPNGYDHHRGMNWAVPEVRAYKLALLTELAENYALAGLEMDFLRDDRIFRLEETTEAQRVAIMTGFVKQVRAALDRAAPAGKRLWLCMRIPHALEAHGAIGLDVRRLYEAGVDMFNLSDWYHTAQTTDIAVIRKLVPHAAIYHEMTHSAGNSTWFIPRSKSGYGTAGNPRTSVHQFYTTAHLAQRRGADGVSLFNFVYYRMGHTRDVPVMAPPFHVLERLTDLEWLGRQTQYYWLSQVTYRRQAPRKLRPGRPETFRFDVALPTRTRTHTVWVRLHAQHALADDRQLTAELNGRRLKPLADVGRFCGNPFDRMISPLGHRRAWTGSQGVLKEGANDLKVTLAGGERVNAIWVDLMIR